MNIPACTCIWFLDYCTETIIAQKSIQPHNFCDHIKTNEYNPAMNSNYFFGNSAWNSCNPTACKILYNFSNIWYIILFHAINFRWKDHFQGFFNFFFLLLFFFFANTIVPLYLKLI
jgi:hypothetical protein